MEETNDVIYMNQEGYDKFLQSIEDLKEKIYKNDMGREAAFNAGAGDGWDSPEFEEIERESFKLNNELKEKQEMLSKIVVIEKHNEEDMIDIGDVVSVDINSQELVFKLVGAEANFFADVQEISINSPIGEAAYKKKIGDVCEYTANGRDFKMIIKGKIDLTKEEEKPKENTKK